MGGATGAIAAAAARARRRVVSHFMAKNAVSADNAVPFTAGRRLEQKFFDRLRNQGVILPGKNGGYYIDAPKLDAYQSSRRKRVGYALATMVAAAAAGLAIGLLP